MRKRKNYNSLKLSKAFSTISHKNVRKKLEVTWCSCHCLRVHISCTLRQNKVSHSDVRESATDFFQTLHFSIISSPSKPLGLTTNAKRSAKKCTETQKDVAYSQKLIKALQKKAALPVVVSIGFRTKTKNRYLNPKLNPPPQKIKKI